MNPTSKNASSLLTNIKEVEFVYTFSGSQGFNPFSIQVVASSETEARQRALNAVCTAVRKKLIQLLKDSKDPLRIKEIKAMLNQIPSATMPADPIDDHTGCYCVSVDRFFQPVFTDPIPAKKWCSTRIPFDQWIKHAPYNKEQFNPYTIKVYSCLDG